MTDCTRHREVVDATGWLAVYAGRRRGRHVAVTRPVALFLVTVCPDHGVVALPMVLAPSGQIVEARNLQWVNADLAFHSLVPPTDSDDLDAETRHAIAS